MSDKLTMSEMAQELGVSRATVSAVLNGREESQRISEPTAAKVRLYLEERGYVQAKAAMQLKQGSANEMTGILYCGEFAQFSHLVEAMPILTNRIKADSGMVEITCIDQAHLRDGFRELVAKGVTKLLWIHANPPEQEMENAKELFPLMERMKRLVIYNFDVGLGQWEGEYLRRGIHLVGFDRAATYREAASIFRSDGHESVAVYPLNDDYPAKLLPGASPLVDAFAGAGLAPYGLFTAKCSPDALPNSVLSNLLRLYRKRGVDCAFIRNDLLSAEIIDGLERHGVKVPEDMAIISFDGLPMSAWLKVPLTTFKIPVAAMCEKALELLTTKASLPEGQRHIFRQRATLRKSHG